MTICTGDFKCDFCKGHCEQRPETLCDGCLIATHYAPTGGYPPVLVHRLEELGTKLDTLEALGQKLDTLIDLTQQLVDSQT